MNRFLKIILLLLVLFPALFLIVKSQSLHNSFDWIASAYNGGGANPPCEANFEDCYRLDPTNTANQCPGGQASCDGTVGGQEGTFIRDEEGNYWFVLDTPKEDKGGGGARDPTDPPQPSVTPPPGFGTIQVYAITADPQFLSGCDMLELVKTCIDTPTSTGCDAITGSISYPSGIVTYLNGVIEQTQEGPAGTTYPNFPSNITYSVTATHPYNTYSTYTVCHKNKSDTATEPAHTTWNPGSAEYLYPDNTITFLMGMGPVLPWFQIQGGGNLYGNAVYSLMPVLINPSLLFDATQAPASPGILSSLTGFDLSESLESSGRTYISSTNWSTDNAMKSKDWYAFFRSRLQQAVLTPYEGDGQTKPTPPVPAPPYMVYHTAQNPTITDPWVIDGEKLIFIVDGTLTIANTITIQNNGFIAFVVRDDILIDTSVGTAYTSSTPVVEGMYIAGKSIKTGPSTVSGKRRFIGKGMFAANSILLQRNFYPGNQQNANYSADLFLYNPAFLVTMPDILKDLSYTWQEVAP
jgi:hypothetical protein